MTFIDLSTEGAYNGVRADETARLELMEDAARDRFVQEGFVISRTSRGSRTSPVRSIRPTANGCDLEYGERLGADYVLVGEVAEDPNLILSVELVFATTGLRRMLRALRRHPLEHRRQLAARHRYILKTTCQILKDARLRPLRLGYPPFERSSQG